MNNQNHIFNKERFYYHSDMVTKYNTLLKVEKKRFDYKKKCLRISQFKQEVERIAAQQNKVVTHPVFASEAKLTQQRVQLKSELDGRSTTPSAMTGGGEQQLKNKKAFNTSTEPSVKDFVKAYNDHYNRSSCFFRRKGLKHIEEIKEWEVILCHAKIRNNAVWWGVSRTWAVLETMKLVVSCSNNGSAEFTQKASQLFKEAFGRVFEDNSGQSPKIS